MGSLRFGFAAKSDFCMIPILVDIIQCKYICLLRLEVVQYWRAEAWNDTNETLLLRANGQCLGMWSTSWSFLCSIRVGNAKSKTHVLTNNGQRSSSRAQLVAVKASQVWPSCQITSSVEQKISSSGPCER